MPSFTAFVEIGDDEIVCFGEGRERSGLRADIADLDGFGGMHRGRETEPAASAAPVAADAFMKLRRLTRMLSDIFAMSSSLAIGFVARNRALPSPGAHLRLAQDRTRPYVRLSNEGSRSE